MARGNYPSSKQDQYVLRLPDGMRDEIKKAAEANGRSMNAEIISRIEAARSPSSGQDNEYLVQQLIQRQQFLQLLGKLLNNAIEIGASYRTLLLGEREKVVADARMIESLAHTLLELDQAPPPEMLPIVQNLKDTAKTTREQYENGDDIRREGAIFEKLKSRINAILSASGIDLPEMEDDE